MRVAENAFSAVPVAKEVFDKRRADAQQSDWMAEAERSTEVHPGCDSILDLHQFTNDTSAEGCRQSDQAVL